MEMTKAIAANNFNNLKWIFNRKGIEKRYLVVESFLQSAAKCGNSKMLTFLKEQVGCV